jgi:hypothetical protein
MDSDDLEEFSDDQILDEANERGLIYDSCLYDYSDVDIIQEYNDRCLSSIESEIYDKSEKIRQSINNRLCVTLDVNNLIETITGRMCILN